MFIMGVLTINIDFRFPYWDNKSFPYRKSSSRKLHVVSASNLPKVNGSLPCCKVAVLQDGGPLAKSNGNSIFNTSNFPKTFDSLE